MNLKILSLAAICIIFANQHTNGASSAPAPGDGELKVSDEQTHAVKDKEENKPGADTKGAIELPITPYLYGKITKLLKAGHTKEDIVVAVKTLGININVQRENDNWSSLHFAVHYGSADCVSILLASDHINVNSQDKNGFTPLHLACCSSHDTKKVIPLLLADQRINLTVKNNFGTTAQQYDEWRSKLLQTPKCLP